MSERTTADSTPFDRFLAHLRSSRVLSAEQLDEVATRSKKANRSPKPNEVAGWMVREKWLSRWQAQMLLAGSGHSLRLGKYLLLDKLGAGGMGAVYKAIETGGMGRIVAIKTLADHLLDNPKSVGRFRREIQAAAALQHPNIIRIYDAESIGRRHFLVMEYVAGCDLDGVIEREGPLPIAVACEFIRQAACGLEHAHEKGMVHRDIKPQNLLLCHGTDGAPVVKILDMGLAKFARDADAELTGTGQVLGTPDYMAPEQIEDTRNLDIRADIYSLGCTLFKLLTTQTPFAPAGANAMRRMLARLAQEAPSVRNLRGDVPEELDAVVRTMMARQPDERYSAPFEAAVALEPFTALDLAEPADLRMASRAGSLDSQSSTQNFSSALLERTIAPDSGHDSSEEPAIEAKADDNLDQFFQQIATAADQRSLSAERSIPVVDNSRPPTTQHNDVPSVSTLDATGTNPIPRSTMLGKIALAIVGIVAVLAIALAWHVLGQTTLAMNISPADGEGIRVWVDGQPLLPTAAGIFQFVGPPGERKIRIVRPNYAEVNDKISLRYGAAKTFTPHWERLPPTLLEAPFDATTAAEGQKAWSEYLKTSVRWTNTIGMEFVLIPPGRFPMGSSKEEQQWAFKRRPGYVPDDERWIKMLDSEQQHPVRLSTAYYLQSTETTCEQFAKFVAANPRFKSEAESNGKGGWAMRGNVWQEHVDHVWSNPEYSEPKTRPVVFVTWPDAQAFVKWLSAKEARNYRLPTEAEWEYACRAGSLGKWSWGDDETKANQFAWVSRSGGDQSQPAGGKKPNAFGIFDMHGNVMEWCSDWHDNKYYFGSPGESPTGPLAGVARITRGGSWYYTASEVRSAARMQLNPQVHNSRLGFRVVLELPKSPTTK